MSLFCYSVMHKKTFHKQSPLFERKALTLHYDPSVRPSIQGPQFIHPGCLGLAECRGTRRCSLNFLRVEICCGQRCSWGQSLKYKCLITWKKTPRIGAQILWGCVALNRSLSFSVDLSPISEMGKIVLPTSPGTCEA